MSNSAGKEPPRVLVVLDAAGGVQVYAEGGARFCVVDLENGAGAVEQVVPRDFGALAEQAFGERSNWPSAVRVEPGEEAALHAMAA